MKNRFCLCYLLPETVIRALTGHSIKNDDLENAPCIEPLTFFIFATSV